MPRRITALCLALLVAVVVGRALAAGAGRRRAGRPAAGAGGRRLPQRRRAKFRLQREGYAAAIVDPRVVRAMTAGPTGRIALCFLEWASDGEQIVVIDWTPVGSADRCASHLQAHSRGAARLHGPHLDQRRHRLLHGRAGAQPVCRPAARHRRVGRRHQQQRPSGDGGARRGHRPGRHDQRPRHPERGAAADQPDAHPSPGRPHGLLREQCHRRPRRVRGRGRELRGLRPAARLQAGQGDCRWRLPGAGAGDRARDA